MKGRNQLDQSVYQTLIVSFPCQMLSRIIWVTTLYFSQKSMLKPGTAGELKEEISEGARNLFGKPAGRKYSLHDTNESGQCSVRALRYIIEESATGATVSVSDTDAWSTTGI